MTFDSILCVTFYQDGIKCPISMNESKVEMVISTVIKPVFVLCFGHLFCPDNM